LKERDKYQLELATAEKAISEGRVKESKELSTVKNLAWVKLEQPNFRSANTDLTETSEQLALSTAEFKSTEENLAALRAQHTEISGSIDTKEENLKANLALSEQLNQLLTELPERRTGADEVLSIGFEVTQLEQEIPKLNAQLDDSKLAAMQLGRDRDLLAKDVAALLNQESELSALIENLKAYVHDAHCPACGTDHKSKERVLMALSSHVASQSADLGPKSEQLKALDNQLELINKDISNKSLEIARSVEAKDVKKRQVIELANKQNAFYQSLVKLGIAPAPTDSREQLETAIKRTSDQISSLQGEVLEANRKILEIEPLIAMSQARISSLNSQILALKAKIEDSNQIIQRYLTEAAKRGLSLDIEVADLEFDTAETEQRLTAARTQIREGEMSANHNRIRFGSLKDRIALLEKDIREFSKNKILPQKSLDEYATKLRDVSLPEDVSLDELNEAKKHCEQRGVSVRSILETITLAETTIDASELSLEIARLSSELKTVEDEVRILDDQKRVILEWHTFFSNLVEILKDIRSRSVEEFTDKYGPLSSTIQARLRSVYGFGEIGLSSSGGKISVSVKRDEKELRPIDNFSESQKQILVLSLFFASAITQNWSSFSPIFMDDPVTHFDDLNAYAFLDLISGMLQSEGGQRQFIISTCEEKLFQLMRQKFFGYGDRVKIYEFVTIGESGPVYKKIVNGEATEPIH
jgi:exonuclease SbcC